MNRNQDRSFSHEFRSLTPETPEHGNLRRRSLYLRVLKEPNIRHITTSVRDRGLPTMLRGYTATVWIRVVPDLPENFTVSFVNERAHQNRINFIIGGTRSPSLSTPKFGSFYSTRGSVRREPPLVKEPVSSLHLTMIPKSYGEAPDTLEISRSCRATCWFTSDSPALGE